MAGYIVRRVGIGVVTLFMVSMLVFVLINVAPGGPSAIISLGTTAAQRAALLKSYGLTESWPVRFGQWIVAVAHGNFGTSYEYSVPVLPLVWQRLANTALLAGTTFVVSTILGAVLGIVSAARRGGFLDQAVLASTTLGISLPDFWTGTMLIILFSVVLRWLPASGMTGIPGTSGWSSSLVAHMVMPVAVLSLAFLPNMVRITRSALIHTMDSDFVRTARAKGLGHRAVLYRHALRAALVPITSMAGVLLATLLGGSAIAETVFAWPGIGRLGVDAATNRDYPLIMGIAVVIGALVIVINILADVAYAAIDPRVSYD